MDVRSTRRRRITWLAVCGYALVTSGLPLPYGLTAPGVSDAGPAARRLAGKDRSRPFPCRDKPCGCVSAEQCFQKCCCHTPTQLLAWARRHDLEAAVLATLERRVAHETPARGSSCCGSRSIVATPSSRARPERAAEVCTQAAEDACCVATRARTTTTRMTERGGPAGRTDTATCADRMSRVVLAKDARDGAGSSDGAVSGDEPVSTRTIILRSLLACGGLTAEWFSIGGAPPPPPVIPVARGAPLPESVVTHDESLRPRHVVPDVPPPRAA